MKLLGEVHDFRPRAVISFRSARIASGMALAGRAADGRIILRVPSDAFLVPSQLRDSRHFACLRGGSHWRKNIFG